MRRMFDLIGMTVGGWVGWVAGEPISIFTAFILGMVGTGAGLWAIRRYVTRHLP